MEDQLLDVETVSLVWLAELLVAVEFDLFEVRAVEMKLLDIFVDLVEKSDSDLLLEFFFVLFDFLKK